MAPLNVLLSKLGYGTFSSVANHALADQVSKAGVATLCQINSISEQQGFLACSFSLRREISPSSHTSGAATAGSSSLQRLAGGEAAFSVSLSSCCSAVGSAGSEDGGPAESSRGCEASGELSRFRPPWPKPVGNGGARGGSFSAGFEGVFAAAVFSSAAAFGEELEDSSADLDSACPPQELLLALHTSPSAAASPAAARP